MLEEHNHFEINFHKRTDFNFKGVELTTGLIIDEALKRGITNKCVILELNNKPGIWPVHYPCLGKPQNVAGALIDLVFPKTGGTRT